ncbi:hypothetical protein GYMLUDRAFT_253502 [Collybiopsis luxurians FD-317 M1]|uniref:Unplaced genomic scaffold GYMLUscaffold_230, whole genome shotgun sequence n=1 Tax=Collybiopsis luxurians FD-317 M1 TaxID=944289 RepID=A0A0D0C4Z3_9AGAR|nr:hypothetical protein GYMLUDRAFT_253502 [Collybiopsis luxurians FD-317 M1]
MMGRGHPLVPVFCHMAAILPLVEPFEIDPTGQQGSVWATEINIQKSKSRLEPFDVSVTKWFTAEWLSRAW